MPRRFTYPEVERGRVVEEKFGMVIPDEFRWLERPELEKTKKFIEEQNAVTHPYLEECNLRESLRRILKRSQDYVRFGSPFRRGDKYYFFSNSGLQPQAVLFQQDTLDGTPRPFFDPNVLSRDGRIAMSIHAFSPNGKFFAFGISYNGSDWLEIGVIDVETKENIGERIRGVKYSTIEWTKDNKGFFFAKYPGVEVVEGKCKETSSHSSHSLYYQYLGKAEKDIIFKCNFPEHPDRIINCCVANDGNTLHIFPSKGVLDREWYYAKLDYPIDESPLELVPIVNKDIDAEFDYVSNNGDHVYFRTNSEAPNYRIVRLSLQNPDCDSWVDIVPNRSNEVLEWSEVYTVDGQDILVLKFTKHVSSNLELRDLKGKLIKNIPLPPGTIHKIPGQRDHDEVLYQFTSFLTPGKIYRLDLRSYDKEPELMRESRPNNFDPDDYNIDQLFYKSKDGTMVPMFIVYKKDMVMDGTNPCVLFGYGGFNIQVSNTFNINRIPWIKNFKGIMAVANIRGGGEYGREWHHSGRLLKKQNVFDDFIAAAEYLIAHNYTSTPRLAIEGGSNGGLLVAAVSNQRPELFGATICRVAVLDMIRYPKFTIGHAWISEFGDPSVREHFLNLINYSPYHNIPESDIYPATLLLTGDHDDRVVPAHSFKFIARLQRELGPKIPDVPLLIRIDTDSGHGQGKATNRVIEEFIDVYSFLSNVFDLEKVFVDG